MAMLAAIEGWRDGTAGNSLMTSPTAVVLSFSGAGAPKLGVLDASGRLLARRTNCGAKEISSLAIIREDVGRIYDGCGKLIAVASKRDEKGIGVAGLFLATSELSSNSVARFFLANSRSNRSSCLSSISNRVAILIIPV